MRYGGRMTRALAAVFDLDGTLVDNMTYHGDSWVALARRLGSAATREDFDKERDTFVQMILAAKQAEALSLYVKRLREQHKEEIKIDETQLIDAPTKGDAGAPTHVEDDEE